MQNFLNLPGSQGTSSSGQQCPDLSNPESQISASAAISSKCQGLIDEGHFLLLNLEPN